jgi:hypothetical protein
MIGTILGYLPASSRFIFGERLKSFRAWVGRCCVWRYIIRRTVWQRNSSSGFLYIGREKHHALAEVLFKHTCPEIYRIGPNVSARQAVISELPFPESLCIPHYLNTILELSDSIENQIRSVDKNKLRLYKKERPYFQSRIVTDIKEIKRLQKVMLEPYAQKRYGNNVAQLTDDEVIEMATKTGGMHLVLLGDQEVACHIGNRYELAGKTYWASVRAGYPAHVYTDSKTYARINSMDMFMEMEWAIAQGFDYLDLGVSLSNPDNGVIQWKRKLRGKLSLLENHEYFYFKPPKKSEPDFFWESPIISVKNGKFLLHLGWPATVSEGDILHRYQQMGFNGLSQVNFYCHAKPSEALLGQLHSLYQRLGSMPVIKVRLI